MPLLIITPIYVSLILVLAFLLSVRVIRLRKGRGILLGTEGDEDLLRSVRAHGNLMEHVPVALLLMACFELNGGRAWLLHIVGASLLVGRCIHAWSLLRGFDPGRVVGMVLTFNSWIILVPASLFAALG